MAPALIAAAGALRSCGPATDSNESSAVDPITADADGPAGAQLIATACGQRVEVESGRTEHIAAGVGPVGFGSYAWSSNLRTAQLRRGYPGKECHVQSKCDW